MDPVTVTLLTNFLLGLVDRAAAIGALLTGAQNGTPVTNADIDTALSAYDADVAALKAEIARQKANPATP